MTRPWSQPGADVAGDVRAAMSEAAAKPPWPDREPARILVTGSRTWEDWPRFYTELAKAVTVCGTANVVLVHGDARRGADAMVRRFSRETGIRHEPHPADWRRFGRQRAGKVRNTEMVRLGALLCLAFIRNASGGATDCADKAERAKIPVWRVTA